LAAYTIKADEIQILLTRQTLKRFANTGLPQIPVTIHLELDHKPVAVQQRRIDEEHCNPLKVWEEKGCPVDITRTQATEIMEKSAMKAQEIPIRYENKTLTIEITIGVNDVCLITVKTAE